MPGVLFGAVAGEEIDVAAELPEFWTRLRVVRRAVGRGVVRIVGTVVPFWST
jgi:hypothetical protein